MSSKTDKRVYLYDSTLRDGAQTRGVDFGAGDKRLLAAEFDRLGIDYIEGGWPGANPTDDAFFADPPKLARAKLVAFGMTRRPGRSAANDPGLQAMRAAGADAVCLVGKAWDFQVDAVLEVSREENLEMIADSVAALKEQGVEVFFDAEHFFDGCKADPDYALRCIEAAYEKGA
ncbi:MAG: citramalate synthase, partial [Proteobacteria bacterium]|nr:citramalate synthase [Pseudomonadota bacterium]